MVTNSLKERLKRVFILGAGSNKDYKFPTGLQLRQSIINGNDILGLGDSERLELSNFRKAFERSGMLSIDRFLERNSQFEDLGKKLIAWYISQNEIDGNFHKKEDEDHWYFDLYNRILFEIGNRNLGKGEISFVTFNYDRSLEYYLAKSFRNTFLTKSDSTEEPHKHFEEVNAWREHYNLLNIYHVYGQIGGLDFQSSEKFKIKREYSKPKTFEQVNEFYSGIHLVGDRNEEAEHLKEIRNIVRDADVIYCAGFGFDELNMERVGLIRQNLNCKAIFATSKSIGLAQRLSIKNQIEVESRKKFKWYSDQKTISQFFRDLFVDDTHILNLLWESSLHPDDNIHNL